MGAPRQVIAIVYGYRVVGTVAHREKHALPLTEVIVSVPLPFVLMYRLLAPLLIAGVERCMIMK
jgi:hypothetical protein